MTSNVGALRAGCLALVASLTIESGAAQAQQNAALEEITVVAPRLVTRPAGRTGAGSKVELISLTRHVVYKDLNLTLHSDVMQLEKRVNDVASEACDTLAKMYPLSDPNTPNCIEQAAKGAKTQIDLLAAAAMKDQRR